MDQVREVLLLQHLADPSLTPEVARQWVETYNQFAAAEQELLDREAARRRADADAALARRDRAWRGAVTVLSGPVLIGIGLATALTVPSLLPWGMFTFGMGAITVAVVAGVPPELIEKMLERLKPQGNGVTE
jgi:hypothetical protein